MFAYLFIQLEKEQVLEPEKVITFASIPCFKSVKDRTGDITNYFRNSCYHGMFKSLVLIRNLMMVSG